jgi:predicted outer membrane repeat protein
MTMSGCTVTGNTADVYGGGVYNTGTLTITNSTVTENTAGYSKGGDNIFNLGKLYKHT